MEYIHFTDEQKQLAAGVNLEEFMRRRGERLLRSGRDWRLESDHSVTIRGNRWYDHSSGKGGGPVSFVRWQYGLSYADAVTTLLSGGYGAGPAIAPQTQPQKETQPFALPPKHTDMRRTYAYLLQKRFIARGAISQFAREGLLYESAERSRDGSKTYRNAVFVGLDGHGVPRHAHKRGLYSVGGAYKGNVSGSDPAYSFHRTGESERLFVFEAPVDLLSWITLNPEDWQSHSYVALCGVSERAMLKTLECNSHLRSVALCLDSDAAGIGASARLARILRERGYGGVEILRSDFKDWNEYLKARSGADAIPAEQARPASEDFKIPQLEVSGEVFDYIARLCERLPKSVRAEHILPKLIDKLRAKPSLELVEDISALALFAAVREFRQTGENIAPREIAGRMRREFVPRRSAGPGDAPAALSRALTLANADGIRSAARKSEQAEAWLDAAMSCANLIIAAQTPEVALSARPYQSQTM